MTPEEFQHQQLPEAVLRRLRHLQEFRDSGAMLSGDERIELEHLESALELMSRIKRRPDRNNGEPPPDFSA